MEVEKKLLIGWGKRLLEFNDKEYTIANNPKEIKKTYPSFLLKGSKIEEDKKSPKEFTVFSGKEKNTFRASTVEEKKALIRKFEEKINSQTVNNQKTSTATSEISTHSQDVSKRMTVSSEVSGINQEFSKRMTVLSTISSATDFNRPSLVTGVPELDQAKIHFFNVQELIFKMEESINTLQKTIEQNNSNNKPTCFQITSNMISTKDELLCEFDKIYEILYEKKEEVSIKPIEPIEDISEDKKSNDNSLDNEEFNDDDFEDCEEISEKHLSDSPIPAKRKATISMIKQDYHDPSYAFPPRDFLNKKIKCDKSIAKDFASLIKTGSFKFPIYYHEPISMLQRNCERFYHSKLLDCAATNPDPELRDVYVLGFMTAQYSFLVNRILNAFNPIIGETFEYIDNTRGFRYFSEQVSHKPAISAFIGESKDWAFYGDTREKSKFKLFKGAIKNKPLNKTHLQLKQSKDYYTFNKPKIILNGIFRGNLKYCVAGKIKVNNSHNSTIKSEIEFFDDNKHQNGDFEGKVFNNKKVVYLVKGNWNSFAYYTKPDGTDKTDLWNMVEEKYMENIYENYCLPSFSCNLNYCPPELRNVLPLTDSRYRPDLREYEEGDTLKADDLKIKITKKQKEMLLGLEANKTLYQPAYFNEIYSQNSSDYVYIYKGEYWEHRRNHQFRCLNHKIFNIS